VGESENAAQGRGVLRSDVRPAYEAILASIENTVLNILVWGPGRKGRSALYRKRLEIRDVLRREGHAAIFSEETTTVAGGKSRLEVQEHAHAEAADLILVIAGSEGSIAQVHDYARSRRFSSKMHILTDEQRLAGNGGRASSRVSQNCSTTFTDTNIRRTSESATCWEW
jgi:hypothetical protein